MDLCLKMFGSCTELFDTGRELNYLRSNGISDELICRSVPATCFRAQCTLFLMIKVYKSTAQHNFTWFDDGRESNKFSAHIPFSDGMVYFDHPVIEGEVNEES